MTQWERRLGMCAYIPSLSHTSDGSTHNEERVAWTELVCADGEAGLLGRHS